MEKKKDEIMITDLIQKKVKIRTGILFETITTLIVTVIVIISYTYYSNTAAIIEQCEITMQRSAETVQRQITKILQDSESLVEIYPPILQITKLDESVLNIKGLIQSLFTSLKLYPYVTSFYFGLDNGFYMEFSLPIRAEKHIQAAGLKLPETDVVSIIKVVNPQLQKSVSSINKTLDQKQDTFFEKNPPIDLNERWMFFNESYDFIEKMGQKTNYDPRKRLWYKNAIVTKKATWSDLYIFAGTLKNEIGITVSKTMYKDTKPIGVFSIDLTITTFAEFLENNKVTENAQAFLINEQKEIVSASAYKNMKDIAANTENGLFKIEQSKYDHLKKALESYEQNKGKENVVFFTHEQKNYVASFHDFPRIFSGSNWKTVVIAPMEDFIGKISESKNRILLFSLFVVLLAMVLSFKLAQRIAKPIVFLANEAKNIKDLVLTETEKVESNITEIHNLADNIASLKNSMRAFSYYIPRRLVQKLLQKKGAIHIGGKAKEITLLFTDIEGFTSISEHISAENLVHYLSDYFEEMTRILIEHEGTVDKFIGDSIMAFWGAPLPDRNHALNACHSALVCLQKLKQKNLVWKRGERPIFPTRFGIHTGSAIVGNIGSTERMNYTAIGDNINFASRLEGLNKYYGTHILISESVHDKVKNKFLTRALDKIAVKGKNEAIKIYELIAQISGDDYLLPDEEQEKFVAAFEKAYHLYLTRQFSEAREAFTYIEEHIKVGDQSVQIYLHRCREYIQNPPPQDWDGSYALNVKY
ncbi:MAG: hypothetical protein HEEMFOPI_01004 [Holosporales bacterium]